MSHPTDYAFLGASRASSEILPLQDFSFHPPPQSAPEPLRVPAKMAQPNYESPGVQQIPEDHPQSSTEEGNQQQQGAEDVKAVKGPAQSGGGRANTRPTARARGYSNASESQNFPRFDSDLGDENASSGLPPQRNPSRQQQLVRYGPPPPASDYGYEERPYWPRPPHDYGTPMRPLHSSSFEKPGYYEEDYSRPYRRMSSLRESDEWKFQGGGRGPPGPPGRRYRGGYDDGSDDDEDERPLRYRGKRHLHRRRGTGSEKSSKSPPPEIIMRLPFTEWMNRSAKARTYYRPHPRSEQARDASANADSPQTLSQRSANSWEPPCSCSLRSLVPKWPTSALETTLNSRQPTLIRGSAPLCCSISQYASGSALWSTSGSSSVSQEDCKCSAARPLFSEVHC